MRALLLLVTVALLVGLDVQVGNASSARPSVYQQKRSYGAIPINGHAQLVPTETNTPQRPEPKRQRREEAYFPFSRVNLAQEVPVPLPVQQNYVFDPIGFNLTSRLINMQVSFEAKFLDLDTKLTAAIDRIKSAEEGINQLAERIYSLEGQRVFHSPQIVDLRLINSYEHEETTDSATPGSDLTYFDSELSKDSPKNDYKPLDQSINRQPGWSSYAKNPSDDEIEVRVPIEELNGDNSDDNMNSEGISSDRKRLIDRASDRLYEIFGGTSSANGSHHWNGLIQRLIKSGNLEHLIDNHQIQILDGLSFEETYTKNLEQLFPYLNIVGQWYCLLHHCGPTKRIQIKEFSSAVRTIISEELVTKFPRLATFPSLKGIFDYFIENANLAGSSHARELLAGISQIGSGPRTAATSVGVVGQIRKKAQDRLGDIEISD